MTITFYQTSTLSEIMKLGSIFYGVAIIRGGGKKMALCFRVTVGM